MELTTTLVSLYFLTSSSGQGIYFNLPRLGEVVTKSNTKEEPSGHTGATQNDAKDSDNGIHNDAKGSLQNANMVEFWGIRNNSHSS